MTTPQQQDNPDWGRQSAQSDIAIVYNVAQVIAGATSYGPFFVGNLKYMRVFNDTGALRSRVTINWFTDATLTQSLGFDVVVTPVSGTVRQALPVRGAWVRFTVEISAYPNAHSFQAFSIGAPTGDITSSTGSNFLLTVDGTAVGAGITRTDDSTSSRGGWAYWQGVFDGGVAGLIRLYSVDFTGATRLIDVMGPQFSNQGRLIFLPAMPVRVLSTNNDGVARNLYLTVYIRPFSF